MLISVILPCYNEEGNIDEVYSRLTSVMQALGEDYELIFIDDGSTDRTLVKLTDLSTVDSNVKVVEFSRNFGHQAALCAGLDHSRGDAVIMMDADLQHPPDLYRFYWKDGKRVMILSIRCEMTRWELPYLRKSPQRYSIH